MDSLSQITYFIAASKSWAMCQIRGIIRSREEIDPRMVRMDGEEIEEIYPQMEKIDADKFKEEERREIEEIYPQMKRIDADKYKFNIFNNSITIIL